MSKVSVKTFLIMLRQFNKQMEDISKKADEIINTVAEIKFDSVSDLTQEEELKSDFDKLEIEFLSISKLKPILLGELKKKILNDINNVPTPSRVRSLTRKSRSKSSQSKSKRSFWSI
jgi:hypothetical protein